MINPNKAVQVLEFRRLSELEQEQEPKRKVLDFLSSIYFGNLPNKKIYSDKWTKLNDYEGDMQVFEMWEVEGDIIKTKPEKYQFFNPKHNTRTKILSETCLETDKLEFDKAISLMCETMLSLIRNSIHFAVFYAEGQRSPHIRIYDFFELEQLNPKQRIKAQIEFWRQHVPFGCFNYFDTGMFVDDHPYQIEFSLHYKYKTPFNLLFEWIPKK